MNRTDRLSAILIMLQTKKIVKANDIAERFGISLRTVYRDMRALNEAGVPIGAEAGVGYYLVEGYHLPPVMFTPEEAGSMLIAGKLVERFSDESVKQNFNLATDKIKSVLPEQQQDFLEEIDSQVHILHKPYIKSENFNNDHITIIQKALSTKKCLTVKYISRYKEERVSRVVEPVGLCFYGYNWHLIAFCKLRNDYRDFRLDRIESCEINECVVSVKAKISIDDYFQSYWKDEEVQNVSVTFTSNASDIIGNTKYYFGYYSEERINDQLVMRFAASDLNYISSWLLSLGKLVVKAEPPELQSLMVQTVEKLANQYLAQNLIR